MSDWSDERGGAPMRAHVAAALANNPLLGMTPGEAEAFL
jgi:hypothetical protein